MKKTIIVITIFILLIVINPYTIKNYIEPYFFNNNKEKSQEISFQYKPDMYIGRYINGIIIYDGKTLIKYNENRGKEFEATIRSDNYMLDTSASYIYLLDKVRRNIYQIDNKGEIVGQIESDKNINEIIAFSDGKFILKYTTDVKVDGILVYDKNLNLLKEIKYPKTSINKLKEDTQNNGFMASGLVRDDSNLKNSIFYYNYKIETVMATDIADTIIIDMGFLKDKIILMDINNILVMNKEFKEILKIPSTENYYKMHLNDMSMWVLDSKNTIKELDYSGKLLKEYNFNNEIIYIENYKGKLLAAEKNSIFIEDKEIEFQKDIIKIFTLENKIVIVFRDSVSFIKVE